MHSKDFTFKQGSENERSGSKRRKVKQPKMKLKNLSHGLMWKLLMVNTLSCGLEACMAAGTVYIPPLLLQAGMEERYMTMVLVGPVLGLIFVPMIGSASDSLQSYFGRRRPFIWILSLGVLLSLQIIPQAWYLAVLMFPEHPHWLEAALQAGAVCLIDFCGHAGLTLLVALLSDLFPAEEENHRAFSVNSLMTSLGGCLGYLLPAVDWSQAPIATYLGGQEAFVYALLTLLLLCCLVTTVFIREETGTGGEERKPVTQNSLKRCITRYCPRSCLPQPQCFLVTLGRCASAFMSILPRVYAKCVCVPAVIWRLFVAETCSWMALMSVMFFFADFMGEALYRGVPNAEPQSQERRHFDEGVRIASLGLFLQCVVSMLCSVVMDFWVALLGARTVYISGVALLAFATTIMSVSESVFMVTVMAALTGYTLCVLQVLPYTLLCLYHSNQQVFFTSSKPRLPQLSKSDGIAMPYAQGHTVGLTLPRAEPSVRSPHVSLFVSEGDKSDTNCTPVSQRGICFDMAILDSAYLLSQVLPAMCLGSIVQLVNSVRAYMASACCFSLLACLCSTRVVYSHSDLQH